MQVITVDIVISFFQPAPADYEMVVTTLTFGPGIGEQSVSIPIYDDNILEEEIEIFSAFLMSDVGDAVNISPEEATVIIQDEGDSMLKLITTAYIILKSG